MITLLAAALLAAPPRPLLMAHYMPWFAAKPAGKEWGWHWTMGKRNPDTIRDGKRELASHYTPVIGPYDSGDQDVLECHALMMKMAGIDGVFVDWYGNLDQYDYATNHRNARRMFAAVQRVGMKFAVVYEDQTVPNLIKGGKFKESEAVAQGQQLMRWAADHWFKYPAYLKENGRPVFLVFGPQYYKQESDWERMFVGLSPQPAFYTLHHRRPPAVGGYDWPLPGGGDAGSTQERDAFLKRARDWPSYIPVAYPRFHDYYKEAGVHDSYGRIEDRDGATYQSTLAQAIQTGTPFVQIATFNDWGEGTMIEPSVEVGYRDLEATQEIRRKLIDPTFPYRAGDLRLPVRLLSLRRRKDKRADAVSEKLRRGDTRGARRLLEQAERAR